MGQGTSNALTEIVKASEETQVATKKDPYAPIDCDLEKIKQEWGLELGKIVANITKLQSSEALTEKTECIVLVLSGSFNPLHLMHLRTFEIARRNLEDRKHMVVGGFIAPSSNGYVKSKLDDSAMTLDHRNKMCEVALQNSDWLGVCPWGNPSASWVCRNLQAVLEQQIPNISWRVMEIFGADHALKFHKWKRQEIMICLGRPGYSDQLKKMLLADQIDQDVFILTEDLHDMSSTAIRLHLQKEDWNALATSQFLDGNVLSYLQTHGQSVYL
eukprot:TRINITY_DN22145_c0_g1_i1.p1 TRINITY_DN22145_c0_g1~~TRINITY_DN22145_c0_g1_i1.p1  ORF type:complete len:272 (+),score=63.22 TRINITY_DN22145_c0_g1_i1:1-816(+)